MQIGRLELKESILKFNKAAAMRRPVDDGQQETRDIPERDLCKNMLRSANPILIGLLQNGGVERITEIETHSPPPILPILFPLYSVYPERRTRSSETSGLSHVSDMQMT